MAKDKEIVRDLIDRMRSELDEIDKSIIDLVRERNKISAEIIRLKRSNSIPLVEGARENNVFTKYARELGQIGKTLATAFLARNKNLESDFGDKPETDKS